MVCQPCCHAAACVAAGTMYVAIATLAPLSRGHLNSCWKWAEVNSPMPVHVAGTVAVVSVRVVP